MEVEIVFRNMMYGFIEDQPEYQRKQFEINDTTTISQLFTKGDLSDYYPLSGVYSFNSTFLPYIINSQGKVIWDIPYDDAKVIDFIRTHNIVDNRINVRTGYVQAGGPGFKELLEVWQLLYPILDAFNTAAGSVAIIGSAGSWIHSLFKKMKHAPHSQFDLLFSRDRWSSAELAQKLEISNDDAKNLLRLFKYEFDKSSRQYIQHPESLELREKLSSVEIRDIGKDYR